MEQIPGKIETLLADQAFWRSSTKSVAVILTAEETLIHRLSIPVDDQYYVGDTPYLLAIIKNAQFNYAFYLLALNRDSMKVYHVENKQVTEVALPEDAPVDIETALGEEISGRGDFNYSAQGAPNSSGEGVAYHGFSAKDEEVEIDHVNYYQAVDNYFKNEFPNEENLPLYLLHSLKIKHYLRRLQNKFLQKDACIASSPASLSPQQIAECAQN